MSNLLIAVGGSGEHVALAVSRLIYLGALPPMQGLIIDADDGSDLAKKLKSFDSYENKEFRTEHPLPGCASLLEPFDPTFAATARQAKQAQKPTGGNTDQFPAAQTGVPFRALMRGDADDDSGDVFRALFGPEEAQTDVMHGFFARPTLGASAFAAQGGKLIEEVVAKARSADMCIVTGSFIGGTGAGVLPSLVRQLSEGGVTARLYGVFLMEWLRASDTGSNVVSAASMQNNAMHGVEYFFKHMKTHLTATALVGPPAGTTVPLFAATTPADNMGEAPSFFPLAAARCLFSMPDTTSAGKGSVNAFVVDEADPLELLKKPWLDGKSLLDYIRAFQKCTALLNYYCAAENEPNRKKVVDNLTSKFGNQDLIPVSLRAGLKTYAAKAKRAPSLFGGDEAFAAFASDFFSALRHHQVHMEKTVSWFDSVFKAAGGLPVNDVEQLRRDGSKSLDLLKEYWGATIEVPQELISETDPKAFAASLATELRTRLLAKCA